jgi:recombinase-like zinc beta ribbon protein
VAQTEDLDSIRFLKAGMAAGSHGVWGHGRVPTPGEAELARLRERFRGHHIFHDLRWAREVRYLLAGLLACGLCGRRRESAWSNGKAAYRCRHGRTSATAPDPSRPKNAYVREDKLLPHLPALHLLLTSPAKRTRRRIRAGADVRSTVSPARGSRVPSRARDHPNLEPRRRSIAGARHLDCQDRHRKSKLTRLQRP